MESKYKELQACRCQKILRIFIRGEPTLYSDLPRDKRTKKNKNPKCREARNVRRRSFATSRATRHYNPDRQKGPCTNDYNVLRSCPSPGGGNAYTSESSAQ